jgi:hypothetical protein
MIQMSLTKCSDNNDKHFMSYGKMTNCNSRNKTLAVFTAWVFFLTEK